jgi:hypothetical protein
MPAALHGRKNALAIREETIGFLTKPFNWKKPGRPLAR